MFPKVGWRMHSRSIFTQVTNRCSLTELDKDMEPVTMYWPNSDLWSTGVPTPGLREGHRPKQTTNCTAVRMTFCWLKLSVSGDIGGATWSCPPLGRHVCSEFFTSSLYCWTEMSRDCFKSSNSLRRHFVNVHRTSQWSCCVCSIAGFKVSQKQKALSDMDTLVTSLSVPNWPQPQQRSPSSAWDTKANFTWRRPSFPCSSLLKCVSLKFSNISRGFSPLAVSEIYLQHENIYTNQYSMFILYYIWCQFPQHLKFRKELKTLFFNIQGQFCMFWTF